MKKLRAKMWYKVMISLLLVLSLISGGLCVLGGVYMLNEDYYSSVELEVSDLRIDMGEVSFAQTWTPRYALISACYNLENTAVFFEILTPEEAQQRSDIIDSVVMEDGRLFCAVLEPASYANASVELLSPDGEVLYNCGTPSDGSSSQTARIMAGVDSKGEVFVATRLDNTVYGEAADTAVVSDSDEWLVETDSFDFTYITYEELVEYANRADMDFENFFFTVPLDGDYAYCFGEDTVEVPLSSDDSESSVMPFIEAVWSAEAYRNNAAYLVIRENSEAITVANALDVLWRYARNEIGSYYNSGYDEEKGVYFVSQHHRETVEPLLVLTAKASLADESCYDENMLLRKFAYDRLYPMRQSVIVIGLLSAVVFVASFVLLLFAAGWKKDSDTPRRTFIDKIPLEIYCGICVLAAMLAFAVCEEISYGGDLMGIVAGVLCTVVFTVIEILFCMSIARRIKTKTLFKNTLCFYIAKYTWRFVRALPSIWKIALAGLVYGFASLLCIISMDEAAIILWAIISLVVFAGVCVFDFQLGSIVKTTKKIAAGESELKISTDAMRGRLRDHADSINSIGESVNTAVSARMKSERMKTDLIANVSHDIKTPLTSVINYIDLLSRTDITDPTAREYIAVLERQSVRLKRLVEDIVEASKASSGCINACLEPVDLRELLDQATAEYSDRLAAGSITPVVSVGGDCAGVMADGRLLWRVFDNLLSNISKYSQPGTRAYIKAVRVGDKVEISFRNVSAQALDIPVDVLMERFIRGDRSRYTEGSGLGLSIAQSLIELQNGQLVLSIDGDLFRAAVMLPACELPEKPDQPVYEAPVIDLTPAQPTYAQESSPDEQYQPKPEDGWLELPGLGESTPDEDVK